MEALTIAACLRDGLELPVALQQTLAGGEEEPTDKRACQLCQRIMPLTDHHLIPRDVQKKYLKRGLMQEADRSRVLKCCRQCHNAIHRLFDHEVLAERLNTLEALLEEEKVQSWVAFASKQKARAVSGLRVAR